MDGWMDGILDVGISNLALRSVKSHVADQVLSSAALVAFRT